MIKSKVEIEKQTPFRNIKYTLLTYSIIYNNKRINNVYTGKEK